MTKFERWFIGRILKQEVQQGFDHDKRIMNLYSMIREVCEKEFYEDNQPTLNAFLLECFTKASNNLRQEVIIRTKVVKKI